MHIWSIEQLLSRFEAACVSEPCKDIVFDTSGASASFMQERIKTASLHGFDCVLLWVDVPLFIAVWRNRQRAAAGGSYCDEHSLVLKAGTFADIFATLQPHVLRAEHIINRWDALSFETKQAQMDVFLHPYPADTLPCRPGKVGYGEPGKDCLLPTHPPEGRRQLPIGHWIRSNEMHQHRVAFENELMLVDDISRERYILNDVL